MLGLGYPIFRQTHIVTIEKHIPHDLAQNALAVINQGKGQYLQGGRSSPPDR